MRAGRPAEGRRCRAPRVQRVLFTELYIPITAGGTDFDVTRQDECAHLDASGIAKRTIVICLLCYIITIRRDSEGRKGGICAICRRTLNIWNRRRAKERCHNGCGETRITGAGCKEKSASRKPFFIGSRILMVLLTPRRPSP